VTISRRYAPYLLCAPTLLYLLALIIYPMVYSALMSFKKWDMARGLSVFDMPWVGLANFQKLAGDATFRVVLGNTLQFMVVAVGAEFVLGFAIALLLNRRCLRWSPLWMTLILVPMMLPSIAAGQMWRVLFDLKYGVINAFVQWLGVKGGINFLGSPTWALRTVMIVDIWQWTPFVVLILLAGLRSLPEEPYEAARVDGAGAWASFRFLTLPLLSWPILIVLLMRLMDTFKIFDAVYSLTYGGPGVTSTTASFYIYLKSFKNFELGYGAALSWLVFFIVYLMSVGIIRFVRREADTL